MKKLLLIAICGVLLSGCSLVPKKAGVEIMSNPSAKVYLDGREAGSTPYKNTNLEPGDMEIKLVVNGSTEWVKKVYLFNYTNTVIDWDFGEDDNQSGGYVLTMEKTGDAKKSGLLVNANPDKCAVLVDNDIKGFSPTKIEDVGEGDRQVTVSFPGYKSLNLFVKGLNNYQLIVDAKLGQEKAKTTTATPTPEESLVKIQMVKIKNTETGWLRVRESADANAKEINKIKPGEKYRLVEETGDWMMIDVAGIQGWISARYAEKVTE